MAQIRHDCFISKTFKVEKPRTAVAHFAPPPPADAHELSNLQNVQGYLVKSVECDTLCILIQRLQNFIMLHCIGSLNHNLKLYGIDLSA